MFVGFLSLSLCLIMKFRGDCFMSTKNSNFNCLVKFVCTIHGFHLNYASNMHYWSRTEGNEMIWLLIRGTMEQILNFFAVVSVCLFSCRFLLQARKTTIDRSSFESDEDCFVILCFLLLYFWNIVCSICAKPHNKVGVVNYVKRMENTWTLWM